LKDKKKVLNKLVNFKNIQIRKLFLNKSHEETLK